MHIILADPDTVLLADLPPAAIHLLRQIPVAADVAEGGVARRRLYPEPVPGEPEFNDEWGRLVTPELRHLFASSLATIRADLATLSAAAIEAGDDEGEEEGGGDGDGATLRIPRQHLEAWLNGLNQARLAVVARRGFTEDDLEGGPTGDPPDSARDLALLQVHFYGFLQEHFIRIIGGGGG